MWGLKTLSIHVGPQNSVSVSAIEDGRVRSQFELWSDGEVGTSFGTSWTSGIAPQAPGASIRGVSF
jgi:hypothetical protein